MPTKDQVVESPKAVIVPAVNRSIVGTELVRDISTSDKKAKIILASTGLIPGAQKWIETKEAVAKLPDIDEVEVEFSSIKAKDLNEAYEVLGDTYKRWQYNRLISVSDYARRAAFAENSANRSGQADYLLEMLRKLEDLGLATGLDCRKPWGCGRRNGRQCRWR